MNKGLIGLPVVELILLVAICRHVANFFCLVGFFFFLTVVFSTFTYQLNAMAQHSILHCNIGFISKKKHASHLVFNSKTN